LKELHVAKGTGWNRELSFGTVVIVTIFMGLLAYALWPIGSCGPMFWPGSTATCRRIAQRTMLMNHAKQVGVAANLYAADFNDTFPVWSSALGQPEVLDSDHLYTQAMKLYTKNDQIWQHPVAKLDMDGLKHGFAYNFWGLGGIFQCANPTYAATSPLCTDRTEARFAEFADEKYNRPARTSEIGHCLPASGCEVHRCVVAFQEGRGPALRPGGRLECQRRSGQFPLWLPYHLH